MAVITIAAVSLQFRLMGDLLDVTLTLRTAALTTIVSVVANLLPLPGAAMTRYVVLKRHGAASGTIATTLVATAGLWLSFGLFVAAVPVSAQHTWPSIALATAGALGTAISWGLLRKCGGSTKQLSALSATQVMLIVLGITRLWLAFIALGFGASFVDTAALAAAAPASAAVGFFPSGIGLRELLASLLGPLGGLNGSEAALATAIDRAIGLAALLPVALIVSRRWGPAAPQSQ